MRDTPVTRSQHGICYTHISGHHFVIIHWEMEVSPFIWVPICHCSLENAKQYLTIRIVVLGAQQREVEGLERNSFIVTRFNMYTQLKEIHDNFYLEENLRGIYHTYSKNKYESSNKYAICSILKRLPSL